MNKCIYCREDKQETEFSLEHILPQFLGGALAPDFLKTRQVCKSCNNNLGLFVDASFKQNWFINNCFNLIAFDFFDPEKPMGLSFGCIGNSDLQPPEMLPNEICELWVGPFGERVYWIRTIDERLPWYVGGNPRTAKTKPSRAYFLFSNRSHKNSELSWYSFADFLKGKKVKKVLCGEIDGIEISTAGFSEPDDLDKQRKEYFFKKIQENNNQERGSALYYTNFDIRFMAKIAIGVAYSLFGDSFLETNYSKELTKALWFRREDLLPKINFGRNLGKEPRLVSTMLSNKSAVTLAVVPNPGGIGINLDISGQLNWVIQLLPKEELSEEDISSIGDGFVIVLFEPIGKCFKLNLSEFIAYKCGDLEHAELNAIYSQISKNKDYFKNL